MKDPVDRAMRANARRNALVQVWAVFAIGARGAKTRAESVPD